MSKKRKQKRGSRPTRKGGRARPQQVRTWLDMAGQHLIERDYEAVVQIAQHILKYVPEGSKPAGEAYNHLGVACAMLQDFDRAYEAFTKALAVFPEDATIWYNRASAARYAMRLGQSVRDLERALELGGPAGLQREWEEELAFSRKIAREEMAMRGPDFTLDDLIEQQELFQSALQLAEKKQWAGAEQALRRVIEIGDCHPQPWGNLAGCLIMQERYDKAEKALRRALEIEPDYDLAQRNLAMLPMIRQTGALDFELRQPFKGQKLKQDITFIQE